MEPHPFNSSKKDFFSLSLKAEEYYLASIVVDTKTETADLYRFQVPQEEEVL